MAGYKTIDNLSIGDIVDIPIANNKGRFGDVLSVIVAAKNHTGFPTGTTTFISEKVIQVMAADGKEPNNTDVGREDYGNNFFVYSNIYMWLTGTQTTPGWWFSVSSTHPADAPPTAANVTHGGNYYDDWTGFRILFNGYKYGGFNAGTCVGQDFNLRGVALAMLKPTVDGGGIHNTISSTVFIPSTTELGLENLGEGTKFALFNNPLYLKAEPTQECIDNSNGAVTTSKPVKYMTRTPDINTPNAFKGVFPLPTQLLSSLPLRAKIKDPNTTYLGQPIIWKLVEVEHAGYPVNSATLITERSIALQCFDAREPSNPNANRAAGGSNRYRDSNIRQWLNSDASAGAWYTAQHPYDMPPSGLNVDQSSPNVYEQKAGFLNGFSSGFKNALLPTSLIVALNTVTDGGGSETVTDKMFLASNTEVNLANENGIAEGSLIAGMNVINNRVGKVTAEALNDSVTFTGMPADDTVNWRVRLRTPLSTDTRPARMVEHTGSLSTANAWNAAHGIRPLCNIPKDTLVSTTTDSDGCYTLYFQDPLTVNNFYASDGTMGIRPAFSFNNIFLVYSDPEPNGHYRIPLMPTTPPSITIPSTVYGGSNITVTWGNATNPEGGPFIYRLQRSLNSGSTWQDVADIPEGTNTYTETVQLEWNTVTYRVMARAGENWVFSSGAFLSPDRQVTHNIKEIDIVNESNESMEVFIRVLGQGLGRIVFPAEFGWPSDSQFNFAATQTETEYDIPDFVIPAETTRKIKLYNNGCTVDFYGFIPKVIRMSVQSRTELLFIAKQEGVILTFDSVDYPLSVGINHIPEVFAAPPGQTVIAYKGNTNTTLDVIQNADMTLMHAGSPVVPVFDTSQAVGMKIYFNGDVYEPDAEQYSNPAIEFQEGNNLLFIWDNAANVAIQWGSRQRILLNNIAGHTVTPIIETFEEDVVLTFNGVDYPLELGENNISEFVLPVGETEVYVQGNTNTTVNIYWVLPTPLATHVGIFRQDADGKLFTFVERAESGIGYYDAYPPIDSDFEYILIAYAENGLISRSVYPVRIPSRGCAFFNFGDNLYNVAKLGLDVQYSMTLNHTKEIFPTAGTDPDPLVFYGPANEYAGTVSGAAIRKARARDLTPAAYIEDLKDLADWRGFVVMRLPFEKTIPVDLTVAQGFENFGDVANISINWQKVRAHGLAI
jgi:hypothetical protein